MKVDRARLQGEKVDILDFSEKKKNFWIFGNPISQGLLKGHLSWRVILVGETNALYNNTFLITYSTPGYIKNNRTF